MVLFVISAFAAASALPPSGKWTVDYQPTMCVASRQFGPQQAPTYLAFQPSVSMDSKNVKLFVLAPNSEGSGVRNGRAVLTLQPSGATKSVNYVSWVPKSGGPRGYEMDIDAVFMSQVGQSTGLSVDAGKEAVAFATGKVQPVLDAMATCNDKLMLSWGADPAAKAEAVGNPGDWFSDDDYPKRALSRHVQGRSVVVVTVDPEGRTKACRVAVTSGDADLDSSTCDVARRHGRYIRKSGGDRFAVFAVRWMLWN